MIHGLELQGRSLAATQGDQDNIAFLVGLPDPALPYLASSAQPCHAIPCYASRAQTCPTMPYQSRTDLPYHTMLLLLHII